MTFTTSEKIQRLWDGEKAGIVAFWIQYEAWRVDTGKAVLGSMAIIAEVVPENEGMRPGGGGDARTVWKWDAVVSEKDA